MGSLLAVYDPSGKLGLTDPSPGGGTVPVVYRASPNHPWRADPTDAMEDLVTARISADRWRNALLLVTEDGTPDPVGMARAREVLARVLRLDVSRGVVFDLDTFDPARHEWFVGIPYDATGAGDALPDESAPEALARLLAEHAGVEVVRG